MEHMFTKIKRKAVVNLKPNQLNKHIDTTLRGKIQDDVEGKCMKMGYIRMNSVEIISRSLGKTIQSHFNGSVSFTIDYIADVCFPVEGDIFHCKVLHVNKMGIILDSVIQDEPSPINVLLAKQHHMNNDKFDTITVGNKVYIKVIGTRFDAGEEHISVIGILSDKDEYNEYIKNKDKDDAVELQEQAKRELEELKKEVEKEKVQESEPEPEPEKEPEPEPEPEVEKEKEPEPEPEKEKEEDPVQNAVAVDEPAGEPIEFNNMKKSYKWLSNYNVANPFEYRERMYPTIEHAFHAQKATSEDETKLELYKDLFTVGKPSYIGDKGNDAKKHAGKTFFKKFGVKMVKSWDKRKIPIMRGIVKAYYNANPELKQKLIETGNRPLIHAGFRIDDFWGMKGKKDEQKVGQNKSGIILMELREEFKKEANQNE